MSARRRTTRRVLAVLALVAAGWAAGAGVASAHDELVSSTPSDGQSVDAAPSEVVLEFADDLVVLGGGVPVAVTDVDGDVVTTDAAVVDGTLVRQPLPLLDDGEYRVAYRVVSGDGHVVTGSLRFFVGPVPPPPDEPDATTTTPGRAAVETGGSAAPELAAAAPNGGDGLDRTTLALAAGSVLLLGLGGVALRRSWRPEVRQTPQ